MYSFTTPDGALTIVSPSDLTMAWIWAASTIFVIGAFLLMHAKTRSLVLVSLLMLAILAFITSNASVVLDAAHGKAYVRTVDFFYPRIQEYSFSSVMGADVATSENSDAVRLVFNSGSDLQLTFYNQMGGKREAAFAINQYIRQHGGQGLPY
jgi:hypothetical protein